MDNDDTRERSQRAKPGCSEQTFPCSSPSQLEKASDVKSTDELAALYSKCFKNKINHNNAFDFAFTKVLEDLASSDGTVEIIQWAAGSLDISAIIYSYRVDSIYQETIKMVGYMTQSLVRTREIDEETSDSDGDNDFHNESIGIKKRKKGATLEKDTKNLDSPINLDHIDDSSYLKISTIFNEKSSNDNFLIDTLEFFDDSLCFWLEDAQVELPECRFSADPCSIADLEVISSSPSIKGLTICPAFENFRFDDRSADDASEHGRDGELENSHVLDLNDMDYEFGGSGEDEHMNYSIPESSHNTMIECREFCGREQDLSTQVEQNHTIDLFTLCSMLSENPTGYSFFDERCFSSKSHKSKETQTSIEKKRGRPRKATVEIIENFAIDKNELQTQFNCEHTAKLTVSARAARKWTSHNTIRPIMVSDYYENLTRFFLRPDVAIWRSNVVALISRVGAENLHDSQNYCPAGDYNEQIDRELVSDLDDGVSEADTVVLLTSPQQFERLPIRYETSPKRINMGRLINGLWSILTRNSSVDAMNTSMKLTDLYTSLYSKFDDSMQENLSVPLVAVALLQLANDKTLCLETVGLVSDIQFDSSTEDIIISQRMNYPNC